MSAGSRILEKYAKRLEKYTSELRCGRVDLQLTDYKVHSPQEAKVLIQYNASLGTPKTSQLCEWALSTFRGAATMIPETVLNYPEMSVVTALVESSNARIPASQAKGMLKTGNAYLDKAGSTWEVREKDGNKYLVRVSQEDLTSILEERLNRLNNAGSMHHAPRLAHVEVLAGITDPDEGDHVSFYKDGRIQFGKVTRVTSKNVTISINGESVTTDRLNLIAVTKESPQATANRKQMEEDFYAEAYGDRAFAKKLVRG